MNRILPYLFVALLSITQANAQTYTYSDSRDAEGFNITSRDPQKISLTYSIREFSIDDIDIRGESMKLIRLDNHFLPGDEGAPDLPGSGRYIALPQGARPILHIKSVRKEVYANVNIAPAPRIPKDTERGPLDYNKNARIYSNNAFYPAEPIKLSEVTQVRGVDAVILGITPFQYNPVTRELVVYRDIEMEIEFTGGNGRFGDDRLRSRWWEPLLSDILINYDQLTPVDYSSRQLAVSSQQSAGTRATGYEYLIICPNDPVFISWADSIRLFRTMQGIYTGIVTTSEIGGNTVADIEGYVNNAYETWDIPPAAILLLGDYGTLGSTIISPVWDSYCVSDHIFADVNYDDEEEIIFARMTARNAAELEIMIRKAIDYETNPPVNPDFYNHPITALGWQTERWFQICSEVVGGYFKNVHGKDPVRINAVYDGNPAVDPWSTADNTSTVLDFFGPSGLGYIPDSPAELGGWTGGTATGVNNALNAGSFLLQHRDHGGEYGWGEPDYSSDNIDGLTNTDLSFIFSINCLTGKYNIGSECFAEKFHRYTYNGEPAGALGLLAASEVSYSFVNDVYVWGVFDNMFPDFMPAYGTTPPSRGMLPAFGNAAGKFFLKYSSWPYNTGDKEVTYNLFHHHGDAFTCLYSEVPQNLTVIHDPVQLAGLATFTIRADEGALIALSVNGELIGVATGTGSTNDLPIVAQNPPTEIDVVVTKENFYRYHAKVQVIPPNGPFVVPDSYLVNDASGNNNNKLDYGENVSLDVTLKNLGTETAENVMLTFSSEDEFITLIDHAAVAGTILPNETALVPDALSVIAAENIPNGHNIRINMEASDGDTTWAGSFNIKANAPVLEYVIFTISDASGNNNGRLDPGETADLTVFIKNKGTSDAYNVYGLLGSQDPFIEILTDSVMFGDVAQNTTSEQTFQVSAVVITPPGHQADFSLSFSGNMGITANGTFSLFVGLFPILILDLDANTNSGDKMQTAIEDWRVFAEYTEEIPADLSQYQTIFLCLGTYSENYVLSENEAMPFIDFLNNGGNLYMEGADTWYYDQIYNATSLHPMFNISGLSDGTGDLGTVNGVTGTITEGMTFYFSGDNNYIDHIAPVSPAVNIFSNNTPFYNLAVAYDAGNYKTIGSAFEFGGLMDNPNSTRKILMRQYLDFFGMEPISEIPETPTGDTMVCVNTPSCVYSTQPVPGALYYIWELNPPAAGTTEGWGTEVTVNWTPGYLGSSTLRVCGMNQTGLGPVSTSLLVNHYEVPTAEINFTNTTICAGDTTFVNITLTGITPWHLVISLGGNEIAMNSNKPNMDGIPFNPTADVEVTLVSVSDGTGCESTGFTPTMITVMPLPGTPAKPTGLEYVGLLTSTQSVYQTAGSANSSGYVWELEPPEAGVMTISENGMDCTIDWVTTFTGEVTLYVKGLNDCGESDFSEHLAITVANTYGIDENESGVRVAVYPNPNNGNFQIELSTEKSVRAKVRLIAASGEPVWGPSDMELNRKLSLPISIESLPEGIYLIQVETVMGISNQKVIINK
jgi:hypothetical protein